MNQAKTQKATYAMYPKYLWFFILSYAMVISISNWFDARPVEIFHHAIFPGAMIFPLSFLISDIVTEVYGFKNARLAIWSAFLFNFIFILFGQCIIHLPSPKFAVDNAAFDRLLSLNMWIVIGSFCSYLVSEPLNSMIVSKLKIYYRGRNMGLRFLLSTIIASGLDSTIFTLISFGHIYSTNNLISLIINIWAIKVIVEIIGLSFSVRLAKRIKEKEQLDIYDYGTSYTLLSVSASYEPDNNHLHNNTKDAI